MNFQFYIEKLHDSDSFKKFRKENPDAFLCSCFFVVDLEGNQEKQHFDFFIPEDKKMFSFQIEKSCELVPVEVFDNKSLNKILFDHDFEFKQVEDLIVRKMVEEGIKNKIHKMLFSLQNKNGKDFLIGTVFISMMGMLKVIIDLDNMKITEFEKKSFLDIMKVSGKKKD